MDFFNSKDKGIIVLSVVVLIFIVLSVFSGIWDSEKTIKNIKISKATIMPEKDIRDTLFKMIDGKVKTDINLELLEQKILNEKYIKDVIINFEGSSSIYVKLEERVPVALLVDNSGNVHFFDEDGIILPFSFKNKFDYLYIVSGIYFNKDSKMILSKIAKYIKLLDSDKYRYAKSVISDITYDYLYESVIFRTKNHNKVLMGDCNHIANKLEIFETFISNEISFSEISGYIDCRWDGMIVMKN